MDTDEGRALRTPRAAFLAGWLVAAPLAAQGPLEGQDPPAVLQITVERIKPTHEGPYDAIERELAMLCKERCPNAYLALESFTSPKEIYWLTAYRTEADVARIAAAYADDALLRAEMSRLSAPKAEFVEPAVQITARYRLDLSDGSPWLVGILPFAVIVDGAAAAGSGGTIFELPNGDRLAFVPVANAEDTNAIAAALGPSAKRFAVRPEWSKPSAAWIIANPALWSPR